MWTGGQLVNAALGRCCGGRCATGFRRVQGRRLKYPPTPCAIKARCPLSFQPVRSTLRALYLPLGKRMRSPVLVKVIFLFGLRRPCAALVKGAHGKHDVTMGVAACRCREWRNQRTFLWKQIERNSIPGQAGSVPLWITLWGAPRQSLWQAGRSRLSRKAPRCSTGQRGQRKRAGAWGGSRISVWTTPRFAGVVSSWVIPSHSFVDFLAASVGGCGQRLTCPCPGSQCRCYNGRWLWVSPPG